ncbi:NAD(P)H-dependent oxidoreductase [Paenibacillus alkaliterrae]|uniref:NAD(P)H-dependent oxidoreductase n=1 Tax=Paenibacillus alkaliterrae TaxID=320909 RepID=UPI001F38ACCB|nr:NAD(P)H-dependent oxidoreductase [Paenibacillus alkaliterrae]MCF2940341.1 NAD(P)H-dependent oxidoreductase [Paenibacillus alkaliterrae]
MKHLIVYCHPNPDSFNNAIVDAFISSLKEKGHEVVFRDLYALRFDPVLKVSDFEALREGNTPSDIVAEQEHIKWADAFTMVYPIWWTGLPALIKGYIDRVFSYGFAYAYGEDGKMNKLLSGMKGLIINTHGTTADLYSSMGMYDGLKITSDTGIYEFCGIEPVGHIFFGGVTQTDDAERKRMLEEVKEKAVSLFE